MKLNCFHCHQPLQVAPEQLGTEVSCPHCGQTVSLPKAGVPTEVEVAEGASIGSWIRNSVSGLVSVVVHMTLMLVFALITCDYRGGEGEGEEVLIGELPQVQLSDSNTDQLDVDQAETPSDSSDQLDEVEVVTPPDQSSSADLDVNLMAMAPSGASGAAGQLGTIGGGGGALGGGVSFMGLHAKGTRFCIIADHSGSMSGPKLDFVKEEILETLSGMQSRARFQIFFFNSRALAFPQPGWRHPKRDRGGVEDWLKTVDAGGGTYPTPAFRSAFALQPRPDAIFFMTDGQFPPNVVQEVAGLNRSGKRVMIHTISFMDRSAESLMRKIAKDAGGKYRHVSGF